MSERFDVLVSHNGIPSNWPGRIELWLVNDRYEIRGGREVFPEHHYAFESLLDEATMYDASEVAPVCSCIAKNCHGGLWAIKCGGNVERYEFRTVDGIIYPDTSTLFPAFATMLGCLSFGSQS